MLISFVIILLRKPFTRSYNSRINRHLAPGSCSVTLPCFPDVLTLVGRTLFCMVDLWSVGIQTLLKSFAYPDPRCLWNARSLIVTRFNAHTFSEFQMASDLHEICHPIARWFKSFQPRTPWKYLWCECSKSEVIYADMSWRLAHVSEWAGSLWTWMCIGQDIEVS